MTIIENGSVSMNYKAGEPMNKKPNETQKKMLEGIPDFPAECCDLCGMSCAELKEQILLGNATKEMCIVDIGNTELYINGQNIQMVPFVKRILENAVRGVVSELDGYDEDGIIDIKILGKRKK